MHGRRAARGGTGWLAAIVVALALAGCGDRRARSYASASAYAVATAPPSITVVPGDTVYGIARRYGLPVRDVIAANDLAPPYVIAVGQTLRMPRARYHAVAH
ncbi:MAG: LysM peptidoglycan-binding domain-containing protein, partial [Geminicoccales bacterium]